MLVIKTFSNYNIFLLIFCTIVSCSKLNPKKNYKDPDNDTIVELDTERRNVLQSVTLKANHVYDDENQLESAKRKIQAQVLNINQSEYGLYKVSKGEQLQTISEKIYGTPDHWKELALLNEEKLIHNEVKPGMVIRYKKIKAKNLLIPATQSSKPIQETIK